MKNKRNKQWRKAQSFKKMKRRLKYFTSIVDTFINSDGKKIDNPKWIDMLNSTTAHQFKNTGTPCSCGMCSYLKYERIDFKKISDSTIKEAEIESLTS